MKKISLLLCLVVASSTGCGGGDDSALRGEKEKLEASVKALEQEKVQKQSEHVRLKAERDRLANESSQLKSEFDRSTSEFESEKKSWSDARQSLLEQNESLQSMLREKSDLQEESQRWALANQSLKDEIEKLQSTLKQAQQQHNQASDVSSKEIEKLNESLGKLKKELTELDESNLKLAQEAQKLREDLSLAQSGTSESARLSKDISDLRKQNEALEKKHALALTSLEDLNRQVNTLQGNVKDKTDQLAQKTSDFDALNTVKQSLETDNEDIRKQLADEKSKLEASVKGLLERNLELSNKVRDFQGDLETEKQKSKDANVVISDLQRKLKDAESLRESEAKNHVALDQQKSSDIASLKVSIDALQAEQKKLTERNGELEALLVGSQTMIATLESEKTKQQTNFDQLSQTNLGLEKDIEDLRKQLVEEKAKLEASVNDLLKRNVELNNKLSEAQGDFAGEAKKAQDLDLAIVELQRKLREAESLIESAAKDHGAIDQQKSNDIASLKVSIDALQSEQKKLTERNSELETLLAGSQTMIATLESEKTKQQTNFDQLSLAKQSLETENGGLRTQLEEQKKNLELEIEKLSEANGRLASHVAGLQDTIATQKKESDNQYAKLVALHQTLGTDFSQLKQLEQNAIAENVRLNGVNKDIQDQLEEVRRQREEEQKQNEASKAKSIAKLADLSESVGRLETEKQVLVDENLALNDAIGKLNTEARRQEDERRKQTAALDRLNDAKQNLEEDAKTLRSDLEAERNALKVKNAELISVKKDFNTRLTELAQDLDVSNQRGLQKDDAIIELESRLAEEKRKGLEAIRAAEERERLRVRSEVSSDSIEDLRAQIATLETNNHNLKFENENAKSTIEGLQKEVLAQKDPREVFKEQSRKFLDRLAQVRLFDRYSKNQIATFLDDIRYLTRVERLLDAPEQDTKRFSLPLPLVFDQAPTTPVEFTVYIAAAVDDWDEMEKTAQFLLATDDEEMLKNLLMQKGKGEFDYREFKVQVEYPILCIAPNIFMLPKVLLNPLHENEVAKVIELNYGFDEGLSEPLEYQTYVEKRKIREERIATSKNQALKQ